MGDGAEAQPVVSQPTVVTRRELLDAVLEDEPKVAGDPFHDPPESRSPPFDNAFTSEPASFSPATSSLQVRPVSSRCCLG